MVEIEFLGPIKFQNIKMQASNLGEVKEKLSEYNELELNEWLKICAVAVNDDVVTSLDTPLKDGDKISILPPICGG
ncbi:MoaD/ThiS family protein [Campylobacter sp. RM9344]|uniref:MoaD/ThiS family protein n=1 Tax=Campylobacter californiensis TaxID=1032243 RepID=A0AAW3ZXN5_9BACT|nr:MULTISPECIES: MoaD/ThiS family protein [unclassified Campylobacter]MBE2984106.1 MoaD/ThiS family protein [Campylobacter sp. RM6883]MBE2986269.1 MoaD/ThiS family protein [Campylobacter sp. RM12919]MBE2988424.1 MoaD/ThiS family protein [Campylobacter sp. RM12920]MBE2995768.1 MoaD/ThiS family protein [Campylobacter sp. RM6913]MBE3029875.1 MoaD/ThiS family protein [Campylobacter sp. RM9344]